MIAKLRSLIKGLLQRPRLEQDMQEEMRFHMEAFEADLIRSGTNPQEARRLARREFGSVEDAKEECRHARGLRWHDELARNVRYSLRILRKSPGFTIAAVSTLALCLGANTAIFSVMDAVLFRPLPYPEPDRIGTILTHIRSPRGENVQSSQDGTAWEFLKQARSFDLAAMSGGSAGVNLVANGRTQYVRQHRVSAGYFRVLQAPPVIGREFTADEDRAGAPPVAILSHALWRRIFNADASVVGRSILLRGEPHTIAGILPANFRPMTPADLWTPLRPSRTGEGAGTNYTLLARLHPDATWVQADTEARSLGEGIIQARAYRPGVVGRLEAAPLQAAQSLGLRKALYVLWAAVGVVLLIGCVNIAALLLARSSARTREIGTRMALGGGSGAVIRQMLTESLVIAILGAVAGLAAGYGAISALTVAVTRFGIWQELRLDWRVMGITLAVACLTSIVFGLAPALQAARVDLRGALSEGGSRSVAGGKSQWIRRSLISAEVALSVVLLISAGLLLRTLVHLQQLNPGFESKGLLTASLSLQDARYRVKERVTLLYDQTLERLRATPGIESAAVALHVPYQGWLNSGVTIADGAGAGAQFSTNVNYVTPGYFETLRTPLLAGRFIDARDTASSAPVVVINQAFAERFFKATDVIGRHLRSGNSGPAMEVVGVVGNLQQSPTINRFAPLAAVPAMTVPVTQFGRFEMVHTWFSPSWVVRSSAPQEQIRQAMRKAIEQVDPMLPIAEFRTFDSLMGSALMMQRLSAMLFAGLAALALGLAAVGIYGLISNTVAERRKEIGIRLALGGTLRQVILTMTRSGLVLAAAGVLIGSGLAAGLTGVLRSALHGVQPLDATTYAMVALTLFGVAALASLLPALRIAGLDPAQTLRDE